MNVTVEIEEPVARVAEQVRHRHPAAERNRRVARWEAPAKRRPASGVRLGADHDEDRQHERDQRQLERRVAQRVEQIRRLGSRSRSAKTR